MPVGAGPVVTIVPVAKSGTEIDFTGAVTGLTAGETVTIEATVSTGAPVSASATATTLVAPPPPPPPAAETFNPTGTPLTIGPDQTLAMANMSDPKETGSALVAGTGKTSGKWLLGFRIVKAGNNVSFGLATAAFPLSWMYLGGDANGIGLYPCYQTVPCTFWYTNLLFPVGASPLKNFDADGALCLFAWDATKKLLWVQTPAIIASLGAGAWMGNPLVANADPVAGISGLDVSVLGSGPLWPIANLGDPWTAIQLVTDPTVLPAVAGYTIYA